MAACLLMGALLAGSGRAQDKTAAKLWNDYISAADSANRDKDYKTAEVTLQAALQLAESMGADDARVMLTLLLQTMNYDDAGDEKTATETTKKFKRLEPDTFDEDLLLAAGVFDRLANSYYDRWKAASKSEKNERSPSYYLGNADVCAHVEFLIQSSLLKEDDPALAQTEAFYGLILSKKPMSDPKSTLVERYYQGASKTFETREIQELERLRNTQHFSVMTSRSVESEHTSENALVMRLLLARQYVDLGDDHAKAKQDDLAKKAYKNAEENFERALKELRAEWPDHTMVGYTEWRLALLYEKEGKYDAAARELRKVLPYLETPDGLEDDDLKDAASELATVLDKIDQKDEAAQVRNKYHLKKEEGSGK